MSDDVKMILREIRDELRAQNRLLASHSKATLSISAAAKLIGIDRHELAERVAAGDVRSVPHGSRRKIPRAEVERIAWTGLPRREAPAKPQRRKPASAADAIRALPLPESGDAGRGGEGGVVAPGGSR